MPFKYNALLGLGLDDTIPLDGAGKIPSTFLPSYVDDVEEYNNLAAFPATGETGKIYVAIDTGFAYRWSGSVYVQIGITAAAGATTQVQFNDAGAFGGDSGLTFNKTTDALSAGGFIPTSSTVPANGIYLPAANSVAVATNGAGRLFVGASGNVGIGISAARTLDVNGTSYFRDAVGVFNPAGGSATSSKLIFGSAALPSAASIFSQTETGTAGNLQFQTAQTGTGTLTERLRVTSAGLVGIGTSAPQTLLEISANNSAAASNTLRFTDTDTTTQIGQQVGAIEFFSNDTAGGPGAIGKIECNSGGTSGNGNLYFKTGFASTIDTRLTIDSAGLVGIGTTSPATPLHIEKAIVTNDSHTGAVILARTSNLGSSLFHQYSTTVTGEAFGLSVHGGTTLTDTAYTKYLVSQGGTHIWYGPTTSNERFRCDSSGRLLVGTSTARTNVFTIAPRIQYEGSGLSENRFVSFGYNGTDAAGPGIAIFKTRAASAGGNTAVVNADTLGELRFCGADGTNIIRGAEIGCYVDGTPGANDMPGRIVLATTADGASSPTERMRITSSGFTKSSNTGLYENAAGLFHELRSNQAGTPSTLVYASSASYAGVGVLQISAARNTTNGTYQFLRCRHTSADRLLIQDSGNVENANNSYGAVSDIKLKENIVDATSQWNDLKALQVRRYNFREETGHSTHTQIGLVAQELELVSPGLVSESPDRDEDGNDLGTVTKSVNYSVLYMKAVKALQEAMERIETLEAAVTALQQS